MTAWNEERAAYVQRTDADNAATDAARCYSSALMASPHAPSETDAPGVSMHARDAGADEGRTLSASAWITAITLLAALVVLDRFVLHTNVLTTFQKQTAQSPLYAFWIPKAGLGALVFVALAAGYVALAPRICDPRRVGRAAFLALLAVASAALPLALWSVRESPAALGANLDLYRDEEFVHDARKIPLARDARGREGVAVFLEHYVELMPRLSLHGQHFPPGHALFAHTVASAFGPSSFAQGVAVLVASVAAALAAWLALRTLLDECAARQAALLLAAAPSWIDFACTSMDAVFLLWAALGWLAGVRALRAGAPGPEDASAGGRLRGERVWESLACGALLSLAALASFAVLFVGVALLAYGVELARRGLLSWTSLASRLAFIGAAFALGLVAFWLATGFAWWDCLLHARESGLALMTRILHGPPSSRWLELSVGNAGAYGLGAGVAIVAAVVGAVRAPVSERAFDRSSPRRAWCAAALLVLAFMSFGGLFFMETERIWLFTLPWLAAVALASGAWSARTLRVLLAVSLAQALAMESALFTLW